MTAFEDFVALELPRRSAHLTKTITGWDADPNDGGAPAILVNSPLGTWFREETAGKWWRKTESVWVEAGGGSGGGIERTTEDMVWEVDYATGVSPPDGTVITSQAEYDALGAPLKYVQDVERVRPVFIDHLIKASVLAGNQYAMMDIGGTGQHGYLLNYGLYLQSSQTRGLNVSLPILERTPGILFQGARTDVYTGIAGTLANVSEDIIFTRSSGTWTPGELVGKFAEFTSGSASGRHSPIVANDATTCTVQMQTSGMGATTLTVFVNSTIMVPLTGPGGSAATFGFNAYQGPAIPGAPSMRFQYLDVSVTNFTGNTFYNGIQIFDCTFRGSLQLIEGCLAQIYYSIIELSAANASTGLWSLTYSQTVTFYYGWIRGRCSSATAPLVRLELGGLTLQYARITPDAGITGGIIEVVDAGRRMRFINSVKIDGVTTAIGIVLLGEGASQTLRGMNLLWINNCAIALKTRQFVGTFYGFKGSGNTRLFDLSEGSRIGVLNSTLLATYTTAKATIDGQDYTAELAARGDGVEGQYGSSLDLV